MAPLRKSLKRKASIPTSSAIQSKINKAENVTNSTGAIASTRKERLPGVVLVFGDGISGQLGLTMELTEKPRPTLVPNVENIIDVAAGGMHTVCLTSDHKLITFGCNDEGALGRDTNEEGSEAIPGPVEIPGKIVQISAGDSHTAALLDNGVIYVCGTFRDIHGSLGLLKTNIEKLPMPLESTMKFTKIASGCHHLALLGVDGQLLTPALIRIKNQYAGKFVDVWAGSYNTLAKDNTGNIHVWGLNNYNQLGTSETLHFHPVVARSFSGREWKKISGGEHHTLCLEKEGNVYVLGRKEYGRLGLGENSEDATVPTKVEVGSGKKVIDISCGNATSFALTEDGQLYSWGMGSSMLGVGEEEDLWSPALVRGKQLENRKIVQIEGGGQHTVILTNPAS